MADIVQPIRDILTQLSQQDVKNGDGSMVKPYVRIWNDQIMQMEAGDIEMFPLPAFFLEIKSPIQYEILGQGYRDADLSASIHIAHEWYNDGVGVTFEQDLDIFILRAQVLDLLSFKTPTGCGPMMCILEEHDIGHKNIYHMILTFVTNFTDGKGSHDGRNTPDYQYKQPPTGSEIDVTTDKGGAAPKRTFIINKLSL